MASDRRRIARPGVPNPSRILVIDGFDRRGAAWPEDIAIRGHKTKHVVAERICVLDGQMPVDFLGRRVDQNHPAQNPDRNAATHQL